MAVVVRRRYTIYMRTLPGSIRGEHLFLAGERVVKRAWTVPDSGECVNQHCSIASCRRAVSLLSAVPPPDCLRRRKWRRAGPPGLTPIQRVRRRGASVVGAAVIDDGGWGQTVDFGAAVLVQRQRADQRTHKAQEAKRKAGITGQRADEQRLAVQVSSIGRIPQKNAVVITSAIRKKATESGWVCAA